MSTGSTGITWTSSWFGSLCRWSASAIGAVVGSTPVLAAWTGPESPGREPISLTEARAVGAETVVGLGTAPSAGLTGRASRTAEVLGSAGPAARSVVGFDGLPGVLFEVAGLDVAGLDVVLPVVGLVVVVPVVPVGPVDAAGVPAVVAAMDGPPEVAGAPMAGAIGPGCAPAVVFAVFAASALAAGPVSLRAFTRDSGFESPVVAGESMGLPVVSAAEGALTSRAGLLSEPSPECCVAGELVSPPLASGAASGRSLRPAAPPPSLLFAFGRSEVSARPASRPVSCGEEVSGVPVLAPWGFVCRPPGCCPLAAGALVLASCPLTPVCPLLFWPLAAGSPAFWPGAFEPGALVSEPTLVFEPGALVSEPTLVFEPGALVSEPTLVFEPGALVSEPTLVFEPGTFAPWLPSLPNRPLCSLLPKKPWTALGPAPEATPPVSERGSKSQLL
ncbi:hypothetical protein Ntsu_10180 [Nocardia sp. IFM 10818]